MAAESGATNRVRCWGKNPLPPLFRASRFRVCQPRQGPTPEKTVASSAARLPDRSSGYLPDIGCRLWCVAASEIRVETVREEISRRCRSVSRFSLEISNECMRIWWSRSCYSIQFSIPASSPPSGPRPLRPFPALVRPRSPRGPCFLFRFRSRCYKFIQTFRLVFFNVLLMSRWRISIVLRFLPPIAKSTLAALGVSSKTVHPCFEKPSLAVRWNGINHAFPAYNSPAKTCPQI